MSPYDVFDSSAVLDPTRYAGQAGAARLLQAAQHFPGGPVVLVLALFFAPVGPGVPAGVLLARHVPLTPAATFGLYALSDAIAAIVCHPLFALLRRHGRRVKPIRWLGRHILSLAMIGVRAPGEAGVAPALSRIATVGFGVDVYHDRGDDRDPAACEAARTGAAAGRALRREQRKLPAADRSGYPRPFLHAPEVDEPTFDIHAHQLDRHPVAYVDALMPPDHLALDGRPKYAHPCPHC